MAQTQVHPLKTMVKNANTLRKKMGGNSLALLNKEIFGTEKGERGGMGS